MFPDNPAIAEFEACSSLEIFLAPLNHGGCPNGARVDRPLHDGERDNDFVDPLAQQCQKDQSHEDGRERQLNIDNTHQKRVQTPAIKCGGQADGQSHRQGDRCAADRHDKAGAQSPEDCTQNIAACSIRAQQGDGTIKHFLARRQSAIENAYCCQIIGVCGRYQRCQRRESCNQQHKQPRNGG